MSSTSCSCAHQQLRLIGGGLLRNRSSSSACATSSSATRGMWPPRHVSWNACVPCYIWSCHLARRWTYRRNARVPSILAKPVSMVPVQGSPRLESLRTRAAHPLVVLTHTLACIRRPHHVAELLVPAMIGDDILAPRLHQQLPRPGPSRHPRRHQQSQRDAETNPQPHHCAAPSACNKTRTSEPALAAMRPANCALAKATEADTCGTPSLNLMLSVEMCSPSCAADRCAQPMIRRCLIIATSSCFN